jgi:hypothetical protein
MCSAREGSLNKHIFTFPAQRARTDRCMDSARVFYLRGAQFKSLPKPLLSWPRFSACPYNCRDWNLIRSRSLSFNSSFIAHSIFPRCTVNEQGQRGIVKMLLVLQLDSPPARAEIKNCGAIRQLHP